jgi:hypothetical protein
MKKFTSWFTVILIVSMILPISAYISIAPQFTAVDDNSPETYVQENEVTVEVPETPETEQTQSNGDAYYPDFPELPAPPAPGSPFYARASPPPDYINDENRASRIRVNTSCVISIDSPKSLDFVTLGQNFQVSGGLYEDNNSNGKNDTGDLPIPNGILHINWASDTSWIDVMTDVNGRFTASIPNTRSELAPVAHPLIIEFWGQWTINGSAYYEIPRNVTKNIPGFDDDNDMPQRTTDGIDNDGDWKGWDGSSWNDDLNHNGVPDFDYDGVPGNDDDGNNGTDEETLNGIDDDNDGLVDEDCAGGDANGDFDSSYDPEPNIDELDEGIDEEGIPNGQDTDGDTQIDEDCLLPFIPRLNTSSKVNLIIQHRTEISLTLNNKNAMIGDTVDLSGQLKDPDRSTAVTGKWVILKFHGEVIEYMETDGEGRFSTSYKIPTEINGKKIDVGGREFTAVFDQYYKPDNQTYYKTSTKSVQINIKRPSSIEITNVDKSVYLQGQVTITGRVTDETGAPLLFNVKNDDGTSYSVEPQNYKITLMWGKSAASWAEPPIPGYLGREGNFSITFTLSNPLQPLGRVEVTATFMDLTDKFYTPDQTYDEFLVRGHSKIINWENVKGFHRGEEAFIRGQLVMQDGSITNGLSDAQLDARWGPTGEFENLTSLTRANGWFTYSKMIEENHPLGPVVVYMKFDGASYLQGYVDGFDFTESFAHKTYYVIAQPRITLDGGNIIKGETFEFTGTLTDDTGAPMANQYVEIYFGSSPVINEETGEWEPSDQPITYIPTDSSGKFSFQEEIEEGFVVGTAWGAARFKGFQPPYNASNAYDEATTWNVRFNVSANTEIVVDEQHRDKDLYRGRDFIITGNVQELYKGATRLEPVLPAHGEKLKVDVYMRSVGVSNATTHKVGDATIGKRGGFQVLAKVPASMEISEYVDVTLVFEGNIRYERTTNTSQHKLWGYIFFDRAEILSGFPEKDSQGRPAIYEQDFNSKSEKYVAPWVITVPIYEDIQGRAPPPVANATVYLNFTTDFGFINTTVATTDENGVATFEFAYKLLDKDYPDRIKLTHSQKTEYVLEVTITFVGSTGLQPASTSFNMTYYPTPPPEPKSLMERYGTYISLLVIITIVFVVFMILFSSWYIKQQRLRGLKRIIKRAADQLIAGDQYRATIYKSYKKLSAHLRRYGYLRREAETFREFENAIKQALPIDRPSMHRFLDLLEEARYSSHKIGETQRHAAIANLRQIEGSLSQIIIDEEAAMRALRKLEEEEKTMAAAETEIIVRPGAEDGSVAPGPDSGPSALPPAGGGSPPQLPPAGK